MLRFTLTPYGEERGFDLYKGLGFIPSFLDADDVAPAADQINVMYQHGGGWRPNDYFTLGKDDRLISRFGDPDLFPLAQAKLRDERILFYDYAWTAIVQQDGSFEVSRLD